MTPRTRLTLAAAAATALTSIALAPLATPHAWLIEGIALVLLTALTGAAARRAAVPRPLTTLGQALILLCVLTALSDPVRPRAVAGFLPTPDSLTALANTVHSGIVDSGQYTTPAPATDGIALILLASIAAVALIVDTVAVGYEHSAIGGLPLLALYSVAASLAPGGAEWVRFLCAAFGYLLLLFAEGRDRLSRWGRVFTGRGRHLTPGGAFKGAGPSPQLRTGRRIGLTALGIAVALPLFLPDIGGGLLDQGGDYSPARNGNGTITAVNPLVSMQDSLNQPQDTHLLDYRTDAKDPSGEYLRITALDEFNGVTWRPADRNVSQVPDQLPGPKADSSVTQSTVHTSITARPNYVQTWLPMPYNATKVRAGGNWRFEPIDHVIIGARGQTTSGLAYRVTSTQLDPTRQQLSDAGQPSAALVKEFTKLPAGIPSLVRQDADKVTAGATNHYEQALKLQDWFADSGQFTYDTTVRTGLGPQAMATFLRQKAGYCEHFASAMAVMARYLGIPARVAVGFVPGTPEADGLYRIGVHDAHAWPELYFQGIGWVRFEPTPSRGVQPDYTVQNTSGNPATPNHNNPGATAGGAGPSPSPGATAGGCVGGQLNCGGGQHGGGGGTPHGSGFPLVPVLAGAATVLFLLVLASVPALLRLRVRHRRLGPRGEDTPVPARVLDLWLELLDTAWDLGMPADEARTPRGTAAWLADMARFDEPAQAAAARAAAATERARYAPEHRRGDSDADALAADVRLLIPALTAAVPRRARLRARLLPRSTARLLWALQARLTRSPRPSPAESGA
ncbi:hypothetical protein BIV57_07275 [Mangrovactinospora gilvigrisea]|uniref:Transglutaminase-like domain-containing protein n=1 Tax=Mangrovactinospora gilvigrisea TaxID=1428644 RepID=A0A1J7BHK0_9ACTN|nr:DUF3488 and transglutaminase-like domain-containing protein [Mangrovactinospora gilvigrisea]OIV38171.1 hypothetical protein BIV57_07275 [Mangrovactinospora gilvigrisea]